jgi:hypothetical protein
VGAAVAAFGNILHLDHRFSTVDGVLFLGEASAPVLRRGVSSEKENTPLQEVRRSTSVELPVYQVAVSTLRKREAGRILIAVIDRRAHGD